jgi:chorismate dehydratase
MFTIGVVPYLNALPLYHTLPNPDSSARVQTDQKRIVRAVPSQLAPMLSRGECDVALIPVVEHFRGVGAEIITNACIGSSGSVRSVLMLHRVPLHKIQNVAVDSSSRTSVALLQIILRDAYAINAQFVEHAPDWKTMLRAHEAALIIGDGALEAVEEMRHEKSEIQILDLGAAWTQLTDLPFVYAAWVTKRDLNQSDKNELIRVLESSRDEGVKTIPQLARNNATNKLSGTLIESYFRDSIEYTMTPAHHAGLEEFHRRCETHGLLR